jgi:Kef-type K+ transport system membrane component KefB
MKHLLLQLVVVLLAARSAGFLFARFGQPGVVGGMTAGILLGPSLFGWLAPELFGKVFAPGTSVVLQQLGQIGVILFMFLVGLDVKGEHLRRRVHAAVFVSHTGIVLPGLLGILLAPWLLREYGPEGVSRLSFTLFMAVAMSVTAFPVLARIIEDRGLKNTPLGSAALSCAAVDDVTAWILLAGVSSVAGKDCPSCWAPALAGTLLFVAFMLFAVRPWLRNTARPREWLLLLPFASALVTEAIGIHAFFGAFLAGAVMPAKEEIRDHLVRRLQPVSALLLPLFFAATGLRTRLPLLGDAGALGACLVVIGAAVLGKLGGCMAAARLSGMGPADSFRLGALMNTRGLMELVVLNIGYELGVVSPALFTMFVVMALVTTFAAGPLLTLADRLDSPPHKPA